MRITQIRDFVAAVQHGSLRRAARALGVSQPAITKSIRQLESELQVQLLQRNARGAAPTRAGKAFLVRARVVQSELRKASDDLAAFQGGAEGSLAFGMAPQAGALLVPEAMQQFRHRYPAARVRIVEGVSTALLPQVRDETLDFSINMSPAHPLDGALRFKPLMRLPLVIAGRRGHPLRGATTLKELSDASWVMFYPLGVGAMLEKAFTAAGATMPRSIVHCESYGTALALLAHTDSLGLMAPLMLKEPNGWPRLVPFRVRDSIPAPTMGLYARSDAPLAPAAHAMAQAITAVARRLAKAS